jgi:hypothetical protein
VARERFAFDWIAAAGVDFNTKRTKDTKNTKVINGV